MRQCAQCGKGSVIRGKRRLLRGHYNPVSRARKYPNLQWARLLPSSAGSYGRAEQGSGGQAAVKGKRVKICVACLKNLHRKKA
jgi:ribosomal protein L28